MKRSGKFSLALRTTAAALLLAACSSAAPTANALRGEGKLQADQAVAAAQQGADVSEQIVSLAERGRFDELAHVVGTLPQTPRSEALAESIESYRAHLSDRQATRLAAYEEAMAEAREHMEADEVEEAMVSVIQAHSLAEQPHVLLEEDQVLTLVERVETMADTAMEEHNFVDAVSLYRLLDLLYEDTRTYRDQYEDAATHVRVLELYNPEMLRMLYRERAERLGDEEDLELFDQAGEEEIDDWTVKLEGIDTAMLGQAVAHAAGRHIDQDGYAALVRGAAEGLSLMIQTEGIEEVFTGLSEDRKVGQLQTTLDDIIDDMNRPGRRVDRGAAMALLAEMLEMNLRSVNLPEEVIVYEMTTGAMGELDPFTAVIWPEELRQFQTQISGNFTGIGVQIQKIDGRLTVVTPLEGTPAMEVGLRAEDVIARVNGSPTGTWSVNRAVREITGPEGTEVTLTIHREEVEPFEVTITRAPINVESIKGFAHRDEGGWDYWADREAGIGYIRMTQFLRQTADDMDAAVRQMQEEGELNAIVLDLRFNPGGLLSTAIDVVDRFVERGPIVSTVDGNGRTTSRQSASRRGTYGDDIELVILINQGSASASEIVSGALQDYGRALIIGENTYGKGSVQDIFPISGGSAMFKCTTQYYQLPLGRIIHRTDEAQVWGIQPDLEIEMTNSEVADWLQARRDADVIIAPEDRDPDDPQTDPADILADGLDPQLEAAVLLLQVRQYSSSPELARRGE